MEIRLGTIILNMKAVVIKQNTINQSTLAINFMSSKDNDRNLAIHWKSYNKEIMIGKETWNFWRIFTDHFFKVSKTIVESMKGSKFVFDCVNLS